MTQTFDTRLARDGELHSILDLYKDLHEKDNPLPPADRLRKTWAEILNQPGMHVLVVDHDGKLVASCVLTIIPNLTRGARPYGLVENVVTRQGYRKMGIGTALLKHALGIAWKSHCYKVMLLTGSKNPATLRFYEQAGFVQGVKTGFIAKPE